MAFLSSSRRSPRIITSLGAFALNAIIISIITYQFGCVAGAAVEEVYDSLETGGEEYIWVEARNATEEKEDEIAATIPIQSTTRAPYYQARPPAECTQEPRFSILTSEPLLRSANVKYDEVKKEIWTFGRIYLVLECRSSSPIDFDFDGHLVNKLQSVETSRTTFDDPRLPSCYSIAITIETNREATGNYSCWSLKEPILSTSLYIFAHGGTPPFLLHADIGSEIIEVETQLHELEVAIPCVVTNPNISVALYKIEREGFTFVPIGDYLQYDPKRGFLLQVRKYPEPYGKYKCIAMNSSYYDVIVKLKQPTDNFFHDPIIQGRLEIVQDRLATQSFICNASSQAPNIITTSDCNTPIDCRLARKCLRKNPYCTSACRCSIRGEKCSKTLEQNYAQIGFPIDLGCATVGTNLNGGVVECSAVNFEPRAELTYFIGLNGRIVQNWRNVVNEELVQVGTLIEVHKDTVFFVGEVVDFRCIASRFMFSRGFQWKLKLLNGTIINANASAISSQVKEEEYYIAENMRIKITQPEITGVLCSAPVWNETGWIESVQELSVKDSTPPKFKEDENITVTFYMNEKNNSIVCEAEGFPTPDVMWFKNKEEYIDNIFLDRTIQNQTRSYIFFPEISLFDDQVVFLCNATNPKGTVLKFITIRVQESLKMTLTLTGASFILLLGVFAIILWIFYANSKRLEQFQAVTDQEVEEFFKGNPEAVKKCGDGGTKAIYYPYDHERYEINADNLLIDYKSDPLGQGEFGIVLRGELTSKQGQTFVAVKTTKDSNPHQLRALLAELKYLGYIGKHDNIVNLIGAVTKDLNKREVYVVVEYCHFGCLEKYLRKHRGAFLDEFAHTGNGYRSPPVSYVRLEYRVKTSDLIIWAYQITNALEYLASKKIVHGDVALRNMLLDANQNVKVTDFGLSKHLYSKANQYVTKQKDVLLPWRWLPPETLKELVFSVNGDVWSFGIVLYELFSLADIPYEKVQYSEEFVQLLRNGFRLNRPVYANPEIYDIMRECWRLDPSERPNFRSLKLFFLRYIRMQHPPNQTEIVQQMQLRQQQLHQMRTPPQEFDTESSELDKEEVTFTTFLPQMTNTTFSTFGSVNSMQSQSSGQRSRNISINANE